MSNERQARLADRIRVLIAERLEKGLRDPRLGFVTITDVRVTGDLQHASVFTVRRRPGPRGHGRRAEGRDRHAAQRGRQAARRPADPVARVHPRRAARERRAHRDLLREAQERDAAVAGLPPGPPTRARPTRTSSREEDDED
jgi:ribosome-binding factor A